MAGLYHEGNRRLQDSFDTRRLADRLEEVKVRDLIDDGDRAFIESLDMFFLATADAEGRPTCSYKGGDPGFVRVLDERTLAFPGYDGNGMFLSLRQRARQPRGRAAVHLLRAPAAAAAERHRERRARGPAARELARGQAGRARRPPARCSPTARATSTTTSWSSAPASSPGPSRRRPCRSGSAPTGPRTSFRKETMPDR